MPIGDVDFADDHSPNFGIPWVENPSSKEMGTWSKEKLVNYYTFRQQRQLEAVNNPVGAGWILPAWKDVMDNWSKYQVHIILGGNRSTKSTIASRLCMWAAGTIPAAEVRAYHVNEDRSIEDQQRMIWDAIPLGIRNLPSKKGINHSIQYSTEKWIY